MRLYLSSFRLGNKPEELLKLLVGRKRTAVIANATDFKSKKDRAESLKREIDDLTKIGLEPTEVDLRDYFRDKKELKRVLSGFNLLWVRGGNSFILRRAFKQSGADVIIKKMLINDEIAYGGYSAGIDMLTPSLRGVEFVDDPNIIPDWYDSLIVWDCLNILPYSVAPHYKSDHPESADTDKSVEYLINNHILFIALRDGEVIIRDGDKEKIIW